MESKLVEDLQKLQVFTAYDFFKMDELVQDLTLALEESTRTKGKNKTDDSSKKNKKRSKKRKSHVNPMVAWELGNMSEASESSLDEAIKDYMENIAQQSDSDDLLAAARRLPSLSSLVSHPIMSLAESDSVNENFSPIRPHRRKRRFKRMAVDPQNPGDFAKMCVEPGWPYSLRHHGRGTHCDEVSASCSSAMPHCASSDVNIGKRKRSMRDKTANSSFDVESSVADDGSSAHGGDPEANMDSLCVSESGTSSMSSNESDGLHTNDEARDGDDEQSDFYHEPGPACGIPGIVPWWEDGKAPHGSPATDASFESILRGSFEQMSKTARRNFQTRLKAMTQSGRPYRSGRRRLKDMQKSMYSLSCFLQERQQWTDNFKAPTPVVPGHGGSSSNGKTYDPKRRRKTPPPGTAQAEAVGGSAEPLGDANIGSRILQSMGWNPGSGLGADSQGITAPVQAYRRPWRQGLGTPSSTSTANS